MHQKRRKADFIEPKNQLGSIEESKDIKHSIKIIDRFEKLKRLSWTTMSSRSHVSPKPQLNQRNISNYYYNGSDYLKVAKEWKLAPISKSYRNRSQGSEWHEIFKYSFVV
jgi:hypothetical protein